MSINYFHNWIDSLSNLGLLYLVDNIIGENNYEEADIDNLKKYLKSSELAYKYYITNIFIGD